MRHLKSGRKLGRNSSHRKAMFRNMVTSLLEHGRIETTDAKAKELRRVAARMITLGKKNSAHARRLASRSIRTQAVVDKLFTEIAPGFLERHGGYTRITKLSKRRVGDNASMCVIELMPAGAPELKRSKKVFSAAPKVSADVTMPETKETFKDDVSDGEAEVKTVSDESTEPVAADEGLAAGDEGLVADEGPAESAEEMAEPSTDGSAEDDKEGA